MTKNCVIFEFPGGAVGRVLDLVHRVDEAAVSSEAVHVTSRDHRRTPTGKADERP